MQAKLPNILVEDGAVVRIWVEKVRLLVLGAVIAGIAASYSGPVQARPAVCAKLERQLANAGSSGGSGNSAKYAKAAAAQAKQLQIARGQARAGGCSGGFFSGQSKSPACSKLNNTISRMQANLAALNSKAGSGISPATGRARILAALDANDCNQRDAVVQEVNLKRPAEAPRKQQEGLLTLLFGNQKIERRLPPPVGAIIDGKSSALAGLENGQKPGSVRTVKVTNGSDGFTNYSVGWGNYRTLCVRTCDGYYFPVSYASSNSKFSLDEKMCQQMCPGTEVSLYVHRVPDQEPEEMVSLKGEPYTKLATAFKYRLDGVGSAPGCTCHMQAAAENEGQLSGEQKVAGASAWIPYPSEKPARMDDEETRLNEVGALDAAAIHYLIEAKNAPDLSIASQRNIRVVGPVFLPAREQVEAAQAQDQTTVR